jgi:hypothetical protein
MNHPNLAHWWQLKDAVKYRCRRLCEYCLMRNGYALHHRHYRTWGRERPEDVMLVCGLCHRLIHGLPLAAFYEGAPRCRPGSLADQGDDGHTDSPPWRAWLAGARAVAGVVLEERRRRRWQADLAAMDAEWKRLGLDEWLADLDIRRHAGLPAEKS